MLWRTQTDPSGEKATLMPNDWLPAELLGCSQLAAPHREPPPEWFDAPFVWSCYWHVFFGYWLGHWCFQYDSWLPVIRCQRRRVTSNRRLSPLLYRLLRFSRRARSSHRPIGFDNPRAHNRFTCHQIARQRKQQCKRRRRLRARHQKRADCFWRLRRLPVRRTYPCSSASQPEPVKPIWVHSLPPALHQSGFAQRSHAHSRRLPCAAHSGW